MESMKYLLEEVITDNSKEVKKLEVGSQEHEKASKALANYHEQYVDYMKIEFENEREKQKHEDDVNLKIKELDDQRKIERNKNVVTAASALLAAGVTVWGTIRSMNFEKEDSVTTTAGRNFLSSVTRYFKK